MNDIVSAVDEMIRDGNTSALFGPIVDSFLPDVSQFLPASPEIALKRGLFKKVA